MSVFTDDDVRVLKVGIEQAEDARLACPISSLMALLARLEAAETYAMKMAIKHPSWFLRELYAWRKAAGK